MSEKKSPIVGIDLGTTFSLVAVLQDGAPTLLPNAVGEVLTPSAVSVDERGRVLVGAAALARATTHPEATAVAFKRDMGTARVYTLGKARMTPQQLSALVLGALKRDAEAALGMPIEEAVVTVPAYFDDAQRQATRAAAEIAGLRAERILNEPTAAAIAYGLHERHRELRAAVLDLGGGTFDVTVIEIIDGVIEIQASAGDSRLGGEDFVDALADWTAARLGSAGEGIRQSRQSWARLRQACEEAKRRLSAGAEERIIAPQLAVPGGKAVDLDLVVTREQAEEAWAGLLGRLRPPILRALGDAGLAARDIDEVLLVGGATRMPCVTRLAAQLFGRMPLRTLPPDEAVAMGAAVQAALKQGDRSLDDLVVTDVAPFTLGIASAVEMGQRLVEGIFSPILERGTVIPASRVERFSTVRDFQNQIEVCVYQGEHSLCKDNRLLGRYKVDRIPSAPAGEQSVDVRFTYDLNGILEVETTIVSTRRSASLVLEQMPGRLTPQEIERAREQMARLKFHPRDGLPNVTALNRAEALFLELTGDSRTELGRGIAMLRAALESQEAEAIDNWRQYLVALVHARRRSRGPVEGQ
jgi:molecular chaperone HscC